MSNPIIGRTLGHYKVIDLLGRGGMATVYIGYQETVDRRVAIKVLPPHPGLDENFIERFRIEARTIARLQHPHILPLYDYGTEDNILYLVMAYIEGGTLADKIDSGPMPLRSVEKLLREMASALDYAHRQGVVHRDIKPGNILLDTEGHALLADFGIAKITGGQNITGTGMVGTPAYMAPEQARGSTVDSRIDIYSLGVVIYEMITGQQPFTADTPLQVLMKVMQEPSPNIMEAVDGLPVAIGEVMDKVLAKEPEERYQTAVDFAEAFSRAVHGHEDTLAAARAALPLEQTPDTLPKARAIPKGGPSATQVLTEQSDKKTSPLLIIGGFAIIAVLLAVIVALIVATGSDDDNGGTSLGTSTETPTEEATEAPVIVEEPTVPTFGRLTFGTITTPGDSVNLGVQNLQAPPSGMVYVVWLINTTDGTTLRLGDLALDPLGNASLSFSDADSRSLPAFFDAVAISTEPPNGDGDAPAGDILYSGRVPAAVTTLISEALVGSESGISGSSLLDGARIEAGFAAQHSGLAASATNIGGMHTHAEHTINILRGNAEAQDFDGNGRADNPGRGIGVYFFMTTIESLLDAALNAPEASRDLQTSGEFIRVCIQNTRQRADQMIALEMELLAENTDVQNVGAQATESSGIGATLLSGTDLNDNGTVEAFEGECGLDQIATFGIVVSSMDIVAGPLE